MIFARESFAEAFSDAKPLIERNWAETGAFSDLPCNIDPTPYLEMDAAGLLRIFTARIAGVLVGYASHLVIRHAQVGLLTAMQDALFVDAEFRGRAGIRLIAFADEALTAEGVELIIRQSTEKRSIAPVLTRAGYAALETVYVRRL